MVHKRNGPSKVVHYKNVASKELFLNGRPMGMFWEYNFQLNGCRYRCSNFKTEREAALSMDRKLIELGHPPRHILKAKELV